MSVDKTSEPILVAYRLDGPSSMRLVPAESCRSWMAGTRYRFANRCLPLLIANQAGWFLLNQHALSATWSGGEDASSLKIESLDGHLPPIPVSHFGHGILTWPLSYLFRTPPGYNLLVRGPANWPKDGAYPLEGMVEADWSLATFTMNWKVTRPNEPVNFEVGEPICMLVPQRRGELELFRPQVRSIGAEPEIRRGLEHWMESRTRFLADLRVPGSEAAKHAWQKHYFQGQSPEGRQAPEHQTKLMLRPFDQGD
jgi:hypothetical protein